MRNVMIKLLYSNVASKKLPLSPKCYLYCDLQVEMLQALTQNKPLEGFKKCILVISTTSEIPDSS